MAGRRPRQPLDELLGERARALHQRVRRVVVGRERPELVEQPRLEVGDANRADRAALLEKVVARTTTEKSEATSSSTDEEKGSEAKNTSKSGKSSSSTTKTSAATPLPDAVAAVDPSIFVTKWVGFLGRSPSGTYFWYIGDFVW